MKLEELYINEESFEHKDLLIEELDSSSLKIMFIESKGGVLSRAMTGITGFAKKHPFISGAIAGYATSALKKYKQNQRKTISFYTKDYQEKIIFKDIVKTLMATGKYRKVKDTTLEGGWIYVLKRL